jgi:hypothetical protein
VLNRRLSAISRVREAFPVRSRKVVDPLDPGLPVIYLLGSVSQILPPNILKVALIPDKTNPKDAEKKLLNLRGPNLVIVKSAWCYNFGVKRSR